MRKTIGINKGLKFMIEEASKEGETIDECLSRLIDNSNKKETIALDGTRTNIAVSQETFDKLMNLKIFSTESHISVIFRLLSENKGLE